MKTALVTGSSGFIGGRLVARLRSEDYWVRGADIVHPAFPHEARPNEFKLLDLRQFDNCLTVTRGLQEVYHLAADMGGIGYITAHHASIAHNDALMNLNMLEAARMQGVKRFFYSSSACVYPAHKQNASDLPALAEDDAWPADPEAGYGLEKLFSEKLCQYYHEDYGLETRVARFHNVYGPMGTYQGGKEKAPAALCRKVAEYKHGLAPEIGLWGNGEQTRSFMYVDDCVEGILRLMASGYAEPLNLGSSELVTINELLALIADVAGVTLKVRHDLDKPVGVMGRNSDNTRIREVLGWEPSIPLRAGIARLYSWVAEQVTKTALVAA